MPAKDKYHACVVNALEKDGWQILKESTLITIGKRHLWIDLKAQQDDRVIYVEVKGFETVYSIINYLYEVVGQCMAYLSAIEYHQLGIPLYLAVPQDAMIGILSEIIGQITIQRAAINLLVFDNERETIQQWIPLQT